MLFKVRVVGLGQEDKFELLDLLYHWWRASSLVSFYATSL